MTAVIRTRDLLKSYGRRRGVVDVNLTIERGEIFGFLGPNGAGKSTTIRLLMGFLRASGGQAQILGRDCWTASSSIKRDVGYVAGDVRLYPWLTADRAFRIIGQIRRMDLMSPGHALCDRFRLEPELQVRRMSRGNRQKLALVMALVHQPQLVVLDEPTSGLDPLMQDLLAECLREMAADGRTVFFSSHTLSEVESLCDRVAIVREGTIVADDRLEHLKARAPRTAVVRFEPDKITADDLQWPAGVVVQRVFRSEYSVELAGSAVPLVRWLADKPVADVTISPPNLEALFRSYYREAKEPV